jgi:serine/threonine-protein kinase
MAPTEVVLGNRYQLDERIAAGGMGEVWRATDLVLGRAVAVKLLRCEGAGSEQDRARFRAEARHAGSLSHPGIARVYDYREADPPCLVMELIDGPSLDGLLRDGPLDAARTMGLIAQAAAALQAAHAAGLVHRDIKPGNLLVGPDGEVKITDFGIAHAAGSVTLTGPGTLSGTPAYLAPERVAGEPATPAADLYALGIVAYQCLTGRLPFGGEPLAMAMAHLEQSVPPLPPDVPAGVAALVADLTAKDPRARPATAAQVAGRAEQLRVALSGLTGKRKRRVPAGLNAAAVLAVMAALVALAGTGWLITNRDGPAPVPASATQRPAAGHQTPGTSSARPESTAPPAPAAPAAPTHPASHPGQGRGRRKHPAAPGQLRGDAPQRTAPEPSDIAIGPSP